VTTRSYACKERLETAVVEAAVDTVELLVVVEVGTVVVDSAEVTLEFGDMPVLVMALVVVVGTVVEVVEDTPVLVTALAVVVVVVAGAEVTLEFVDRVGADSVVVEVVGRFAVATVDSTAVVESVVVVGVHQLFEGTTAEPW